MFSESKFISQINIGTKAIQAYTNMRMSNMPKAATYFDDLIQNYIKPVISMWAGETFVGTPKTEPVKQAFQRFYVSLMKLLQNINSNAFTPTSYETRFANSLLFRGVIYRVLGTSDPTSPTIIAPKYNNIYVSWSKKEKPANNIIEKLYGTRTFLTANIVDDYGIDLDFFELIQGHEEEVVYPTLKKSIVAIRYIEAGGASAGGAGLTAQRRLGNKNAEHS